MSLSNIFLTISTDSVTSRSARISTQPNNKFIFDEFVVIALINSLINSSLPHGALLAILISVAVRQACLFITHSLGSCTSSEAHIGLLMARHVGQMHSALSSTTLQPMLLGALQPSVLQGSARRTIEISLLTATCRCSGVWTVHSLSMYFNPRLNKACCCCCCCCWFSDRSSNAQKDRKLSTSAERG